MTDGGMGAVLARCGCTATATRSCPLCPRERPHLACSAACLQRHVRAAHPVEADLGSGALARRLIAGRNSRAVDNWSLYAPHRERVMRIAAATRVQGGICVLGAGDGNDIDVGRLSRDFGQVDLVDVDAAALARCAARLSEREQRRVRLHAPVDLSGLLDQLDAWGDRLPGLEELTTRAAQAGADVAAAIGVTADVVLSTCVLTQLRVPFQQTLVLDPYAWASVHAALLLAHLHTLVRLTRPGGTAILVTDFKHADDPLPVVDPDDVLALLRSHAPLAAVVERPRLIDPWTWTLRQQELQVCAVVFDVPGGAA